MTKARLFLLAAITALAGFLLPSCGGADHSDPQSIADTALECYDMGDYEKLKTLISPENEYLLEQCDNMIRLSKEYREKHPDKKYEKKERTFKSATEEFTGAELSARSHHAVVRYDGDYPRTVVLEKVDGKWYFERLK